MHDALDTTARVLCDTSASGLLLHVHLQQQRSSQAPLTVPPVSLWRAVARCSQPPAAASAGADADTNALLRAQPPSSGLVSAFEDEHEQYQQQRLAGEGENYSAPAANDAAAPTRKYLGPARLPDDKPSSGAPGAATTPAVHAETQVQRPFLSLSPPALPKQDDGSDTEDEEDDDKYKPTLSSSAHHSLASAGTPYSSQPASTSMPLPGIAAASARVTAAPASASQAPKRPLAAPGTTAAEAHKRAELDALRERARVAKRPRVAPTPGSHAGVTDRRVHSCSDDDEENGVNVEDNGGAVTAAAAHPQAGRAENRLPIPPPPPSSATPPNSSGVTPSTADSSVSSSSSTKKTLTKTSGRAARMRF
ncbi:hypothetical protein K437DRAFT_31700 [Tilletiaria anomala UBC 951]|uniref:Uncharacterized protein n=1 Tax=Tilletiaria anomala (strain ATCC 24038 / CBS 436.72 / UBC 951) TaxID=1037660 RepID=A0A066VGQ8_TILAU|nr:uncharacterized protein K437DRAFT_31700 [Tilletiaria anomala UBC 951]KDN37929.1 hypothetical protein K437DRAFT_31700 [Tilletiaria anomala UBC 951]